MTTFTIQLFASAAPEVLGTNSGALFRPLGTVSTIELARGGTTRAPTVLVEYLGGPTGASMWITAGGVQSVRSPGGSWSCELDSGPLAVDVGIGTWSERVTFQYDAGRDAVVAIIDTGVPTFALGGSAVDLLRVVRVEGPTVPGGAGGGNGHDDLVARLPTRPVTNVPELNVKPGVGPLPRRR
jgi:hypothetical protein